MMKQREYLRLNQSKQAKDYKYMTTQTFTTKSGNTLKNLNDNVIHHYQNTVLDEALQNQARSCTKRYLIWWEASGGNKRQAL